MKEVSELLHKLEEIKRIVSNSQKSILNLNELCAFTGLSKSTIYKKTHTGQIPHYKQAKHLFFDRSEIIDWLKSEKGFDAIDTDKRASTYVTLNEGGKS